METPTTSKKVYITMVGSAPMASIDAIILSLDRFKTMLSSDSAQSRFETTIRSIQPSLTAVNAFIEAVYAEKNPMLSVGMTGKTLIVEVALSKNEFLECINDNAVDKILNHVTAVGSMPANKLAGKNIRDYTSFPVKYEKGKFVPKEKA